MHVCVLISGSRWIRLVGDLRMRLVCTLYCGRPFVLSDLYGTGTVPYGTVLYRTLQSQISFALTGFFARANHLFYRFRTVSRIPYVIRPWHESRVRSVSPTDLLLAACTHVRFACALIDFVLYSKLSRHRFVKIRLLPSKIHKRYRTIFLVILN